MSSQIKHSPGKPGRFTAVGTGYWFLQLLDRVSPSQWAAIGVLGSLLFGLLTYLTNLYFKIREDRRKAARGE
ncbi:class II holin family protein [Escherichia coli]|uniref:class II holin family protein n=1 Tax=Shigella flexneri TaxID=623 RepID=UPI001BFE8ACD|nr:class II holin family protein [Escherichia coli]ULJ41078.1 class II holin family protein [Shigella flexneri]